MSSGAPHFDVTPKRRVVLPALLLCVFLVTSGLAFSSTLLPDIASSFKVSIGTASELGLVVNSVGLVMGLFMGALSIRFQHKSLFLFGVAMYMVGELGFFFAQSFAAALLTILFVGIGRAMVLIMVLSLIGGLLPLEKRGWAVGLSVSASMFALVSVPILSASIAHFAGWRSALLWFIIPVAVASLTLGLLAIPSKPHRELPPSRSVYLEAFKQILLNKSAIACLVGAGLLTLAGVVAVYAVSFYRINFSVSQITSGIFASVAAAGGVLGGAGGGRLINRCGRKPLTVVAGFISGMAVVSITLVSNMWVSLAFWAVSATTAAIAGAGLRSLALEQVPRFRGSMMSMYQTFEYVGAMLGVALGGFVLNLNANNFQLLMTILGAFGIASGIVVFARARDPCKPTQNEQGGI